MVRKNCDQFSFMRSEKSFMDYHCTGYIDSATYDQYGTKEGLRWLKKSNHPVLYKWIKLRTGETIELRKTGKKLQYCRLDDDGNIVRDEDWNPKYMTDREIKASGLPTHGTSIVAFDLNGDAVGWVSDEWGADGVFVIRDFQRKGLGVILLYEFRKQFKPTRKIGQMTAGGYAMARSYYRFLKSMD